MIKRIFSVIMILVILCSFCTACSAGGGEEPAGTTEQRLPANIMQKSDPAQDTTLNILMVGNSFCYYYVEELYGLLAEHLPEGITDVAVYNLYYSGCKLDQHYNWWIQDACNYELYKVDAKGRQKLEAQNMWSLNMAMKQANWDYISLQGAASGTSYVKDDPEQVIQNAAKYAEPLLDWFHEQFPKTQLLWHRTWFSEVGRVTSDGYEYKKEDEPKYDAGMLSLCEYMCNEFDQDKDYDLLMVNSGAAWTVARELNESANLLPYGGLCARLGKNMFGDLRENSGDGYHDGDIGGAQLLNAYVWYMTITGDTDLSDNLYEPKYATAAMTYTLAPELIAMLKDAAMRVFAQ